MDIHSPCIIKPPDYVTLRIVGNRYMQNRLQPSELSLEIMPIHGHQEMIN